MDTSNRLTSASATSTYLIGNATSVFAMSDVRVGVWPVLATIGLGIVIILPAGFVARWAQIVVGTQRADSIPFFFGYAHHAAMLVVSLVLIVWLSRGRIGEYGLQWPKQKSYILAALAWGLFFGVLMTVVDYLPQILAHRPPPDNLPLNAKSIIGWMFAEAVYVGPTEEIPFRGVLQTFLMQRTSGRLRLGRFDMHVAGVILAVLFALAHLTSFWTRSLWMAVGQQLYAFALGILYAYWREKSASLVAPIVGHNASDGFEYLLMFLMTWIWR